MRVALFITCFNDTLIPQVGRATVRLLERLGHEVVFPEDQTCCGQMHLQHRLCSREAVPLARRFVEVFAPFETIVTPSASCAATVREHYRAGRGRWRRGAGAGRRRSAGACASCRSSSSASSGSRTSARRSAIASPTTPPATRCGMLRVGDAPLRLLRAVDGIDLVELPGGRRSAAASAARSRSRTPTSRRRCSRTSAGSVARHRRRACCARPTARACCTSAAGSRGAAPACATLHLAEILAGEEPA